MATVAQTSTLAQAGPVDSTTVTLNSVLAGSGLCLLIATYQGPVPMVVTSTGDTWTQDAHGQTTGGDTNGECYIFRAENVGSGTHVVTVNPLGSIAYISTTLHEIRNTPTSSTSNGTPAATAGASSTPATPNITISANTLLMGIFTHVDTTARTITPTYTQLAEDETVTNVPCNMESRGDSTVSQLGAGTYTLAWTVGASVAWCCAVAGWADLPPSGMPPGLGPSINMKPPMMMPPGW